MVETYRPLTPAILDRMRQSNHNVNAHQFHLYGRIILERASTELPNPSFNGNRTLVFRDIFTREIISIDDHTKGAVIGNIRHERDETVLLVSFDHNPSLQLEFSARRSNPETFFSLRYKPHFQHIKLASVTNERGMVRYGEYDYVLRYSGLRSPYLLIRLIQEDETNVNSHRAPGRSVN
jgi:hypothetical protein